MPIGGGKLKAGVYPGGKRFAFTILDDTDGATVENVEPVYRLLESLGMRTTKTVWPFAHQGDSAFSLSETLEDDHYREFVLDLQRRGFEIAFHGASMESSDRARTIAALERFRELFGYYPRVHANHSFNRENIYWGTERFDSSLLRFMLRRKTDGATGFYKGHVPGSEWWWGDLCAERITYVRNLTFADPNVLAANPSMPYHDPGRPWVRYWFSAADAENAVAFTELLNPEAQDRLVEQGGVCIVATHLGKEFAPGGKLNERVASLLTRLASLPGWFPVAGDLLDWLRAARPGDQLPGVEWNRMQWRWAKDMVLRSLRHRLG